MTASRAVRALLALACALAATLTLVTPAEASYRFKAPRSLHAASVTSSTMVLRWTGVRGAKAYQVQYAGTSTMRGARSVGVTRATATLRSLKPSTRYWFRVRVVNARSKAVIRSSGSFNLPAPGVLSTAVERAS